MKTPNDGGPFSLDTEKTPFSMNVCEKLNFYLAEMPPFLTKIIPQLVSINGGSELTATFTVREQELRGLVACFTDLSCRQKRERRYIISMVTNSITREAISKEQLHRITRSSTILGCLLKETGQTEFTQQKGSAFFAQKVSLLIRTIEEGSGAAIKDAPSSLPHDTEWRSANSSMTLRQYIATAALQGFVANPRYPQTTSDEQYAEWSVKAADALIAELGKEAR